MYQLAPSPDLSTKESNYATWENGFSDSEITRIIVAGESAAKEQGSVGGVEKILNEDLRKSTVGWLSSNPETMWLYDKLGWIVRQLNGQFFQFDLTCMAEALQYTVYDQVGSHYDYHMDKGGASSTPRKLSITLQLTDPEEYEGGDLELMTAQKPFTAARTKGLVVAFPSWVMHRVTPVTRGTRRSLVVWVGGPRFR